LTIRKKRAFFVVEQEENQPVFLLAEFQGFEFYDGDTPQFGIGCIILEVNGNRVVHKEPYSIEVIKWPKTQVLTEEQRFDFIFSVLIDAFSKAGLTGGHVMRLPSVDIGI